MANIIDTPLRLFVELTPQGAVAGHYQLEFQRRVEVDGAEVVPAAVKVRDLTSDEGAAIVGGDAAAKAAQVQSLSAQVQTLRDQLAAKTADLAEAIEALRAVAAADAAWDNTPRAQVASILEKNA